MSAHIKKDLLPATSITGNGTTAGNTFHLHPHAREIILVSTVSSRTDGTYTTTLQHSPDGSTWFNVLLEDNSTAFATAAQTADGSAIKTLMKFVPIFPYVRASVLAASVTTGATVEVDLFHGVQR